MNGTKSLRRVSPKLRMIGNGSEAVNVVRSEAAAAVRVASKVALDRVPLALAPEPLAMTRAQLPKGVKRGKLREIPDTVEVNVFVELEDSVEAPEELEPYITRRRESLACACIPLSAVASVLETPGVTAVELGDSLTYAPPVATAQARAPSAGLRRVGERANHRGGDGVLVGIIDVGGFDFAHPDFLGGDDATRFHAIWDQGADVVDPPDGFDYGRVITAEQMNTALDAADAGAIAATLLEPQSQMQRGAHATHVASIAAGNRGVARDALLAGVLIALAPGDSDRRRSFYDTSRVAHAIDWLLGLGKDLGMPVSINISLGTNGHAHDASDGASRWIDYALAKPGRAVSVAAGNAGQEVPERPGDAGYVMGRIHTSGTLASAGLAHDLEWIVVGDTLADLSENELELWYEPQDRFGVKVLPPGGGAGDWIGPIEPGEFVENQELADGTFVSVYNDLYNAANGANRISIFLSPFLSPQGVVGVRGGQWTVRVIGREVRDGGYHAWIERDDPRRVDPARGLWLFPSFFSAATNVDNSSVSSLACGHRVLGVANVDDASNTINITSSQGPTRDGRHKPDVSAPGTDVVAAKGFSTGADKWVSMTGTSMAAPFVTGVSALMLATEPELTAAQMLGIIRRSTTPLPGTSYAWRNDAGFGRIDPEKCVREALGVRTRKDLTP